MPSPIRSFPPHQYHDPKIQVRKNLHQWVAVGALQCRPAQHRDGSNGGEALAATEPDLSPELQYRSIGAAASPLTSPSRNVPVFPFTFLSTCISLSPAASLAPYFPMSMSSPSPPFPPSTLPLPLHPRPLLNQTLPLCVSLFVLGLRYPYCTPILSLSASPSPPTYSSSSSSRVPPSLYPALSSLTMLSSYVPSLLYPPCPFILPQ